MTNQGKNIILAVSGGVAVYKAVTVASRLFQAGHQVQVLMSDGAQKFVAPLSFSAVTRRKVFTDIFPDESAHEGQDIFPHLYPATHADVYCAVPATANMMAKLVQGMADDIVSAAALPLQRSCRRYFCPAMNADMWNNSVVQENARILRERGWIQIGPDEGLLACGDSGYGRMTEPEEIIKRILIDLNARPLLKGRKLLILSGPTRERIDPVRYISNDSSGKMGKAIAEAASRAGATVEFVTGPVEKDNLPVGPGIAITHIESTAEMMTAGKKCFPSVDAAIFAAAVSDYRPANMAEQKLEKGELDQALQLAKNPDIAATLSSNKTDAQRTIGFALQTHDGPAKAQSKLMKKNLDAIILNGPDSFGATTGTFTLITPEAEEELGKVSKNECAKGLINWLAEQL